MGTFFKQNKKCALTGIELNLPTKHTEKWHTNASLDRINNSKGYIEGNLQWVDKMVNIAKQTYTQEEFIEMCMKVAKHLSHKESNG